MKSKNMTLMMVAIGCGLVAAFLTARLSGKSTPDSVNILVAKKDIPLGTKIDPKELDNLIATSSRPKSDVPEDSILDVEMLKNKVLNRTLKTGDRFSTTDVGEVMELPIPKGMIKLAIQATHVTSAGGFVNPGSKVDLILTEQGSSGRVISGMFLRDVLVLSVDTFGARTEGSVGVGRAQIQSVSLALSPEQSLWVKAAEKRGTISLALRDPEDADKSPVNFDGRIPGFDKKEVAAPSAPAAVEPKVTIAVTKSDLKLNTQIDDKNVNDLFVMKEFLASSVSANAIKDLKDLHNKYIQKDIDSDQPILSTSVGDNKVDIAQPAVPMVVVAPEAPKKKVVRKKFVQTIGSTHYLFVEVGPNDFRLVGPVTDLASVTKPDDDEPAVDAKKPNADKPEEKKPDVDKPEEKKPEPVKPEEKKPEPAKPENKPGERVTQR
jgi:pilus assembly protein CpaB